MCRKIIAEGELDNGNGQADVHAKVRRLPNYNFRFIGRLQLQRNTKQGIERVAFLYQSRWDRRLFIVVTVYSVLFSYSHWFDELCMRISGFTYEEYIDRKSVV